MATITPLAHKDPHRRISTQEIRKHTALLSTLHRHPTPTTYPRGNRIRLTTNQPNHQKGIRMYNFTDEGIFSVSSDGNEYQLSNFTARIIREIRKHDGQQVDTELEIVGTCNKQALHKITIPAGQFPSLQWVPQHWGSRPIIYPTSDREVRIAIQENSSPEQTDVYTHTGWVELDGKWVYLHKSGGIGESGNTIPLNVDLPRDLTRFDLGTSKHSAAAVKASLSLGTIGPPEIAWPLLLATYRAAIGNADFAVHLSGRTGTFKSELVSLHQSHYGAEMDARHLPASWLSTAGALEALAYRAKDAILVVDDFLPTGGAYHRTSLTRVADSLVRAQGNQAGRQRLTDTVGHQKTFYPRGLILSTGEDVPEGHSLRGRMLILDLTPGDVTAEALTKRQGQRELYPAAMVSWLKFLAANYSKVISQIDEIAASYRDRHLTIGHSRTPTIYGQLAATADLMQQWLVKSKSMPDSDAADTIKIAKDALLTAAKSQKLFLEAADPAESFVEALKSHMSQLKGHIRTTQGAIPHVAELAGWQRVDDGSAKVPQYKSYGPTLGWIKNDELFIDVQQLPRLQKEAGDRLAFTQQTLLKRLKDSGLLARTDGSRLRNTVRIHAQHAPRTAIVLRLADVFGKEATEE